MATLRGYKCMGCGYEIMASPEGHDYLMMGEFTHFLCRKCRDIVEVHVHYGEEMGEARLSELPIGGTGEVESRHRQMPEMRQNTQGHRGGDYGGLALMKVYCFFDALAQRRVLTRSSGKAQC